jgi:hypothetical protein
MIITMLQKVARARLLVGYSTACYLLDPKRIACRDTRNRAAAAVGEPVWLYEY